MKSEGMLAVKIIEIDRQHTHTPRLCSSRAKGVDIDSWGSSKVWGSRTQVCIRIILELSLHTSDSGWLTPSCSPIYPQNKSMKIMASSCFAVLGRLLFLNKSKAYSFCSSHSFTQFCLYFTNPSKICFAKEYVELSEGCCISITFMLQDQTWCLLAI